MNENATTINSADLVNQCVDTLIREKGLEKLSVDRKSAIHDVLAEQLTRRINEAIIYRLPEEDFEKAKQTVSGDEIDIERLQKIVEGAGLDMGQIVGGVIERFRKDFMGIDLMEVVNGKAEA